MCVKARPIDYYRKQSYKCVYSAKLHHNMYSFICWWCYKCIPFRLSIIKKQTLITTGKASEIGSEFDHTFDRTASASERAFSGMSDSGRFTSVHKDSALSGSEFHTSAPHDHTMTPTQRRHAGGHSRHGRPPADLYTTRSPPQRGLPPLSHRQVKGYLGCKNWYFMLPDWGKIKTYFTNAHILPEIN